MRERGDPEYLHQMRVALRRERSAFSIFSKAFSKAEFAEMARGLKWLGGQFGPARDWDVFVTNTVVPICEAFPRHPGMLTLQEKCEKIRKQHNDEACGAVESRHYTELMLKLGAWLSAEPWLGADDHAKSPNLSASASGVPVMKFAEPLLAHRHRQLKKFGRKLEGLDAHAITCVAYYHQKTTLRGRVFRRTVSSKRDKALYSIPIRPSGNFGSNQ